VLNTQFDNNPKIKRTLCKCRAINQNFFACVFGRPSFSLLLLMYKNNLFSLSGTILLIITKVLRALFVVRSPVALNAARFLASFNMIYCSLAT
jgi:hypothetical protein